MEDLNNDNFLLYAAKSYVSPHYIESEFFSDLKRIKYIKRLIQQYRHNKELKERLILNHIIMIYNVFETTAITRMLFFKIKPIDYSSLKTFLMYLNYMPKVVYGINGTIILSDNISIDTYIEKKLKEI